MLISVKNDMSNRRIGGPTRPSASSNQGLSATNTGGKRRLRILCLRRPPNGSYGFHLRGGRENGTGFFISHVETGTEAFAQGLRTGDQVLRVNECDVSGALHKDVASLVRSRPEVVLHVKSSGLFPVKNNPDDPLAWVIVKPNKETNDLTFNRRPKDLGTKYIRDGPPPKSKNSGSQRIPVKIVIRGAGKTVLGCSICKGPPEKPGIYVQRVTEGGVAYKSGLRAGDQILSCNGSSFTQTDNFQQAVQAMKGSSSLCLEVLQGAGLELVTGESSGYNSSASSETGDDIYQYSEADARDTFSDPVTSTLTRLNVSRNHIQLDSSRDWKEIEAEWADAEITEKRLMLDYNHSKLSQKASHPLSKSFLNISESVERDQDDNQIYTTCSSCAQLVPLGPHAPSEAPLTKHHSMLDLRSPPGQDPDYKSAMQMSADRHVSKIVIPPQSKNEQSALRRLERLSSAPLQGCSTLPNHCKTNSICSTSSDESSYHDSYGIINTRQRIGIGNKGNQLQPRGKGVYPDSNRHSSEDSDSLLSFPSSTISISDSGSGRFTSKIQIRSPPPAPPPRGNDTKLTRQYRKHKCGHHRKFNHQIPSFTAHNRKCLSQDSFSGSSDDSIPWNEGVRPRVTFTSVTTELPDPYSSVIPPPPPPLLPNTSSSSIPPPAPPMPQSTLPKDGFSRLSASDRLQEITGAASKLKSVEERIKDNTKPATLPDPQKAQHEKLMEEFRKAHALMVSKRESNQTTNG